MTIKIGLTTRSAQGKAVDRLRWYMESLRWAGAEPVVLAPDDGPPTLEGLHGLLLSGGGDVHPRRYGEPIAGTEPDSIDEARDEMEIELTLAALAADRPVLAICRGVQLLNVALGGGLIQDLGDAHRTPAGATKHHLVWVEPGSRLAAALGVSGEISVNTHHHQAIPTAGVAPGLRAVAHALPDGWPVEAVESPNHRFVIGVQWHPERYEEVPAVHRRLFQELVRAAQKERA